MADFRTMFGSFAGVQFNQPPASPAGNRLQVEQLLANAQISGLRGAAAQAAARAVDQLRRNGNRPFAIVVQADFGKLAKAIGEVDISGRTHDTGIYRALNHTVAKIKTQLKRDLVVWVGLNRVKPAEQALMIRHAGPGHLEASVIVKDKYPSITKDNFGAVWNRSMPGATHNAWGRSQMAKGSFMIPGKKPVFHRIGRDRFPIKPLFGPNYARETERHADYVKSMMSSFMQVDFIPRAVHEVRREFERTKAKYGL